MIIPLWLFFMLIVELVMVSYVDIREQKIPNLWSFLNIGLFVLLLFFYPEYYRLSLITFLYSTAFIVVGFGLFMLKIMGGGDSKFLATFYLLIPTTLQDRALSRLLLSTVLIGCFFLITNFTKNFDKLANSLKTGNIKEIKECFGTKFSFAPVILLSWIWLGWELDFFTF